MELFHASHQWATRPADERFENLEDMHRVTKAYADSAIEQVVHWDSVTVEPEGGDTENLVVVGSSGNPARLTHHAFGQLASRVAPNGVSYLRSLPATLAARNLNYGLSQNDEGTFQGLFHVNGEAVLRAATSERYERVWNHEIIERLMKLAANHDLVPAQQTEWNGNGLREGADKSLYASDHDMFAFLMSRDRVLVDPQGKTLRRGVIVSNSEVGSASLLFQGFMFREVCANHIIWGAEDLAEIRLRHIGSIREKLVEATTAVRKYMNGAASLDQARFDEVTVQIAGTKEEVLDKLFGLRQLGLSRKALSASYDAVVPDEDGDPNTVWGFAQGITRHSQETPYADERHALDRAAGKLLAWTF